MKKKARKNTRQDVIDFFNKYHRAPSASKQESSLYQIMMRYIKKGDEEIIALVEKYRDNTKKLAKERMAVAGRNNILKFNHTRAQSDEIIKRRSDTMRRKDDARRLKIYKQHEKTGEWPASNSSDYKWALYKRDRSEEGAKLWEDMHQGKSGEEKEIQKPVKKTPASIKAKKVSELTLCEISELIKLIGDKTVSELIAEPEKIEKPETVDISKIETSLSEDSIRAIIDPNNKEVIVTNSNWKRAKEVLEYVFEDDTIKRHFAYEKLRESRTFVQLVANYAKDNPKKTFRHKDKIVERICSFIPADRYFLENPANIQDLVTNCF